MPPATPKVAGMRKKVFEPGAEKPFKLSRSKLDLFHECPRCFYLDRRLGIGRPAGPPFTLNVAVDALLKKEFDTYRAKGEPHPLMVAAGIDAIPYQHPDLNTWRENFKGVQHHHAATNLLITGAVDDVWVDPRGELIVVDYKATSTAKPITLDDEWKQGYKRQMEVYQWLLRRNGFTVSDTGYFVYVNARKDRAGFDARLDCTLQVIPYTGNDAWVEPCIRAAHACLVSASAPGVPEDCEWCQFGVQVANISGARG